MNDRLAIIGYVFGERYQSFAAIYAYSIIRAYPDYSVLLYFDKTIPDDLRSQLKYLASLGDVRFKEAFDFGLSQGDNAAKAQNVMTAGRWLFYDEWFNEFRWLYIGDIDILILPEDAPLLESHQEHAKQLGLRYSNTIRITADARKLTPGVVRTLWKNRDFDTLTKRLRGQVIRRARLTGLHFVERVPYFDAVAPLFPRFKAEIAANSARIRARDDEELLYQLVDESSLELPPISPTGPDLDSTHCRSVNFRPHHGIHLGLFRSRSSILLNSQVLESYVYKKYYADYLSLRTDSHFEQLLSGVNEHVSTLISEVDKRASTIKLGAS